MKPNDQTKINDEDFINAEVLAPDFKGLKYLCSWAQYQELAKDRARLDKLDALKVHYSRPPLRAVTGWQWPLINENGKQTAREAIDDL
jgi:hypothetical protein